MKTIRISLNHESISNAILDLEAYKAEVKEALKSLGEALVAEGVVIARNNILTAKPTEAYDTGSLYNSITGVFNAETGTGYIRANSRYAVFVEFGTGIVGEQSEHLAPPIITGYVQNEKGHGEEGWWYYDEFEGRKRWTQGMPPRPFMYQTYLALCDKMGSMAKARYLG